MTDAQETSLMPQEQQEEFLTYKDDGYKGVMFVNYDETSGSSSNVAEAS